MSHEPLLPESSLRLEAAAEFVFARFAAAAEEMKDVSCKITGSFSLPVSPGKTQRGSEVLLVFRWLFRGSRAD